MPTPVREMVPMHHRLKITIADTEVSKGRSAEHLDEELARRLADLGRTSAPG